MERGPSTTGATLRSAAARFSLLQLPVLEHAGSYSEVREQALAILREGNKEPEAFRVSSPYRIVEVSRWS